MDIFKGTFNGRAFEVNEKLELQIDKGPMLAERDKELLRTAALGYFKSRRSRHGRFVRPKTSS